LDKGVDMTATDIGGRSVLFHTTVKGGSATINLLQRDDADILATGNDG
jgi:hypothetical protein